MWYNISRIKYPTSVVIVLLPPLPLHTLNRLFELLIPPTKGQLPNRDQPDHIFYLDWPVIRSPRPPMPPAPPMWTWPTPQPLGGYTPPFGPPPVYVMPPVWTGAPYRPPHGGVPLPPIPPDWGYLWGGEPPWWFRGPVLREDPPRYQEIEPPVPPRKPWYEALPFKPGDPIPKPDMPSIQPVPGSAPPPQTTTPQPEPSPPPPPPPEPVKTTPSQPPSLGYWDYWREGRQD